MTLGEIASFMCETISMSEMVEYYGFEVKRNFICCPFHHEKTPSVSIRDKYFKCFGCGEGGNIINFVEKLFNLSFREAVVRIDNDFNLHMTGQQIDDKQRKKAEAIRQKRQAELLKKQEFERYVNSLKTEYLQAWKHLLFYEPYPLVNEFNIDTPEYLVNQYLSSIDKKYLSAIQTLNKLELPAIIYNFKIDRFEAELLFTSRY